MLKFKRMFELLFNIRDRWNWNACLVINWWKISIWKKEIHESSKDLGMWCILNWKILVLKI